MRRWMRSRKPRAPGASATARSSCSTSMKSSASAPAKPARTRSEIHWGESVQPFEGEVSIMAEKKDAHHILKTIKDKEIKFVDLRFTDPRGKWQHVTFDLSLIDEDLLTNGTMFDGSSIGGWKAINESDMTLLPDCESAVIDPFFAQPTLAIFCDVVEPTTGQRYGRCPRSIAKAAEKYMASAGVGDTAYFGPEAEFFMFDDVRFDVQM